MTKETVRGIEALASQSEGLMTISNDTETYLTPDISDFVDIQVNYGRTTLTLDEVKGKFNLELKDGEKLVFSMSMPIPAGLFKKFCAEIKEKVDNID